MERLYLLAFVVALWVLLQFALRMREPSAPTETLLFEGSNRSAVLAEVVAVVLVAVSVALLSCYIGASSFVLGLPIIFIAVFVGDRLRRPMVVLEVRVSDHALVSLALRKRFAETVHFGQRKPVVSQLGSSVATISGEAGGSVSIPLKDFPEPCLHEILDALARGKDSASILKRVVEKRRSQRSRESIGLFSVGIDGVGASCLLLGIATLTVAGWIGGCL